jgi:hypothetical protein
MKLIPGTKLEQSLILARHTEASSLLDWEFYVREVSAGVLQVTAYWPRTRSNLQRTGTDEFALIAQVVGDAIWVKTELEQHIIEGGL